jgi:hypothetical protein
MKRWPANLAHSIAAKLRRLVEAGRVETVSTYHFDDMMGESRTRKPMPVAMKPDDYRDRKEGVCYISEWEFKSNSGCAYVRGPTPDIVTLIVHGNSNYDLRIK